jgi:hypothetical protein
MPYSPIWVSDVDNAYPNEPYGIPQRMFKAAYVYDGKLVNIYGGNYYYSIHDAFNGELFLRINNQPFYLLINEYTVKLWDGDYSTLSPEGQLRAGYISPETLANQAATVTNSISRLKAKVKKPVITSDETEPLIEEETKP